MSPKSIAVAVALTVLPAPGLAVTTAGPPPAIALAPIPTEGTGHRFTDPTAGTLHLPFTGRRLVIGSTSDDDEIYGFAVDGTLAVIPEPRVWALLITGYAMIGFALRRRGWARRVSV